MNRRSLFKKLGAVAVAVAVAPMGGESETVEAQQWTDWPGPQVRESCTLVADANPEVAEARALVQKMLESPEYQAEVMARALELMGETEAVPVAMLQGLNQPMGPIAEFASHDYETDLT
jgi:DNA replication initiation complex subunit (GINS family)